MHSVGGRPITECVELLVEPALIKMRLRVPASEIDGTGVVMSSRITDIGLAPGRLGTPLDLPLSEAT